MWVFYYWSASSENSKLHVVTSGVVNKLKIGEIKIRRSTRLEIDFSSRGAILLPGGCPFV
jgi:hypothetical protein